MELVSASSAEDEARVVSWCHGVRRLLLRGKDLSKVMVEAWGRDNAISSTLSDQYGPQFGKTDGGKKDGIAWTWALSSMCILTSEYLVSSFQSLHCA